MFIHFGPGTFSGEEWTDYPNPVTFAPSSYVPTTINATQWVAQARLSGMRYIILTTKHHDGFTLWNSADTSFGVNATGSGNTTDVVLALANACVADEVAHPGAGVKFCLYYSCWDRTRNFDINNTALDAAYNATMLSHLTELLTNYGNVYLLWIDGATVKDGTRWGWNAVYKLMRQLQPNCLLSVNHAIGTNDLGSAPGTYPAGDIRVFNQIAGDGLKWMSDVRDDDAALPKTTGAGDPKTFVRAGATYYLPFEATFPINTLGKWFWGPSNASNWISDATLTSQFATCVAQGCNIVYDVPPNQAGVLDTAHVAKLATLTTALTNAGLLPF